jgi:hypothetical protein
VCSEDEEQAVPLGGYELSGQFLLRPIHTGIQQSSNIKIENSVRYDIDCQDALRSPSPTFYFILGAWKRIWEVKTRLGPSKSEIISSQ